MARQSNYTSRNSAVISAENLDAEISKTLTLYSEEITKKVDVVGSKTIRQLVRQTKATAPVGKRSKHFRDCIISRTIKSSRGNRYVWCVSSPSYALTHLIVHGHATRNGGRTRANSFLENAVSTALDNYENEVKKVIADA